MSEVQTDVGALITWAEEEARLNRKVLEIAREAPLFREDSDPPLSEYDAEVESLTAKAEKLEAIATELRKLEWR